MSALIDAPTNGNSQLFFAWPEAEHVETPNIEAPNIEAPSIEAPSIEAPSIDENNIEDTRPAKKTETAHGNRVNDGVLEQLPPVDRHYGDRRHGEVRLGSVMIRLLKRYGITDAEINEGLADYAKKTCQSIAS